MKHYLTRGEIIPARLLNAMTAQTHGSYRAISVGRHIGAILVAHQLHFDAESNRPSPDCEAYAEMLILQSELAKLMHSYNPREPMGPGMTAEFERIREALDQVYRKIDQ